MWQSLEHKVGSSAPWDVKILTESSIGYQLMETFGFL